MEVDSQVIKCHTVEEWTLNFEKAKEAKKLVVVDFTATWCGPCHAIAPFFEEWAKKYPDVLFLKVDVDEREDITEQLGVQAMPTFVFLKDGEEVERIVGPKKDAIATAILMHSTSTTTTTAEVTPAPAGTTSAMYQLLY